MNRVWFTGLLYRSGTAYLKTQIYSKLRTTPCCRYFFSICSDLYWYLSRAALFLSRQILGEWYAVYCHDVA